MSNIYPRLTVVSTQACFKNEKPGPSGLLYFTVTENKLDGGGGIGVGLAMVCEYLYYFWIVNVCQK